MYTNQVWPQSYYFPFDLDEGSQKLKSIENTYYFINNLQNALVRIENKTYGICRVTGKLIKKERLKLVPHATLSIEAKNRQDPLR